jgi:hypothetical protein
MIFDALMESSQSGMLILIDGGLCRYRHRRDGQITIYEILSQRPGAGSAMLAVLAEKQPTCIVARCPAHLASNAWYERRGFVLSAVETTRNGGTLNVWRLSFTS